MKKAKSLSQFEREKYNEIIGKIEKNKRNKIRKGEI